MFTPLAPGDVHHDIIKALEGEGPRWCDREHDRESCVVISEGAVRDIHCPIARIGDHPLRWIDTDEAERT